MKGKIASLIPKTSRSDKNVLKMDTSDTRGGPPNSFLTHRQNSRQRSGMCSTNKIIGNY